MQILQVGSGLFAQKYPRAMTPASSSNDVVPDKAAGNSFAVILATGAILVFVLTLMLFGSEAMDSGTIILVAGTIALSLAPWPLWLAGLEKTSVPLFPAFCTYLAVYFAAAPFLAPLGWPDGPVVLYEIAEVGTLNPDTYTIFSASMLAVLIGYYAAICGPLNRLRPFLGPEPGFNRYFRAMLWLMAISHLVYSYIPEVRSLPSIGQLLDPAGLFAVGGLYLAWRRKRLTLAEKLVFLVVLLPLEAYAVLRSLLITKFLLLTAFMFFLFLYERQLRFMLIAALLGAALLGGYRYTTASRSFGEAGLDRFKAVYNAVIDDFKNPYQTNPRTGLKRLDIPPGAVSLIRRVGQYWVFQHVHDRTPDPIPYWRGETLKPLLTTMIPRVLYPDKPREVAGNKFGIRFDLLTGDDPRTSINIPWPTELLANFGPLGLITGMAVIGLCLAGLFRILLSTAAGPVTTLTGLTVLHPLVYPESNISVTAGSIPLLYVCLTFSCFIIWWFTARKQT
tara:strand:- start:834 stop:2351 length:1518 start_codon:yes stop_codon:yes gene_type:complete